MVAPVHSAFLTQSETSTGKEVIAQERIREFDQIVGSSIALECVLAEVERVAPTDSTVLVLGETGTGKE